MDNIQTNLAKAEYRLSAAAAVPFIGAIPALAKAALGLIEASYGSVLALSGDKKGLVYIQHGLLNIVAGFAEAIPLVGFGIFMERYSRVQEENKNKDPFKVNTQAGLFIPYDFYLLYPPLSKDETDPLLQEDLMSFPADDKTLRAKSFAEIDSTWDEN